MEFYDYQALYHKNHGSHVEFLSEHENCDDFLIETIKSIRKGKISADKIFLRKLIIAIESDSEMRILLQAVVDDTPIDSILSSTKLKVNWNGLRYYRSVLKLYGNDPVAGKYLEQMTDKLIKALNCGELSQIHFAVIKTLMQTMTDSLATGSTVLEKIFDSNLIEDNPTSMKNLCYFFDKMIEHKTFSSDEETLTKFLAKYFENNFQSCGVFLMKRLIHYQYLPNGCLEDFKRLTIIIEVAGKEKCSQHFKKLFENFDIKKFSYLKLSILFSISQENYEVKRCVFQWILDKNDQKMEKTNLKKFLNLSNSTFNFDDEFDSDKLEKFIEIHFPGILELMLEIDWGKIAVFVILSAVERVLEKFERVDQRDKETLIKQCETIPKKIDDDVIRIGVECLYKKITKKFGFNIFPEETSARDTKYPQISLENFNADVEKDLKILIENPEDDSCLLKMLNSLQQLFYQLKTQPANSFENLLFSAKTIFIFLMTNVENYKTFESTFDSLLESIFIILNSEVIKSYEFTEKLFENIFNDIENYPTNANHALDLLVNKIIRYPSRSSWIFSHVNKTTEFLKNSMFDKILDVYELTDENQIEEKFRDEVLNFHFHSRKVSLPRKDFRLVCARTFSDIDIEGYQQLMDLKVNKLPQLDKNYKKLSVTHRWKLHFLQAAVHLPVVSDKIRNFLLRDLKNSENQPNVTYLIEILLSRCEFNYFNVLINAKNIESSMLKSIFIISSLQLRMEINYQKASEKLSNFYDAILQHDHDPQVSSYAKAAFLTSYRYLESIKPQQTKDYTSQWMISNFKKDENVSIKNDFRFTCDPHDLFTVDVFYNIIPRSTKMPYEECIVNSPDILLLHDKDVNRPVWRWNEKFYFSDCEVQGEIAQIPVPTYTQCANRVPNCTLTSKMPFKFTNFDFNAMKDLIVISTLSKTMHFDERRDCEVLNLGSLDTSTLEDTKNFDLKKRYNHRNFDGLEFFLSKLQNLEYKVVVPVFDSNLKNDDSFNLPRKSVILLVESDEDEKYFENLMNVKYVSFGKASNKSSLLETANLMILKYFSQNMK